MSERVKSEHPARLELPAGAAGQMGELVRAFDWSSTPLGPMERWSFSLRSIVSVLLHSRQPMFLWWGPELIQIYNDAYVPSFGVGKHPAALGQRGADCWQEIWSIIWPQIDDVMSRGRASWNEDHLVPIFRNQRIEEVYWTYGYSPVFDDDGHIGGTLVVCTETTARVVSERRLRTLGAVSEALARAVDVESMLAAAAGVLTKTPSDVPFALVYGMSADGAGTVLLEAIGLSREDARRIFGADFEDGSGLGALRAAAARGAPIELPHPGLPGGPWPEPTTQGFVAGMRKQRDEEPSSFLLVGISPRLPFDASYREYVIQLADQIALSHARIDAQQVRRAVVEERNNLLLQAPVAIALLTGPDHVYELANASHRHIAGEGRALIGKPLAEAFPELAGSELTEILDRVYKTGAPFVAEEMLVPLVGERGELEERFFKFNLHPLHSSQGNVYGMMALAIDVTELVRSRRVLERSSVEREKLLAQLEAANRAKDEFLAMLGHELRNPLSPIVTSLDIKRIRNGGELVHEDLTIERQVKHLVRLVDDLLDVARITRGNVELRRETADIAAVIHKAVEISSSLIEERGHALEIHAPQGIKWFGDATRLAQVVANLLTNAARYTPPGGHVRVDAELQAGVVQIRVQDDGVGISPEVMQSLFEPFVQGPRGADRAEGGLGIGLALVKNLVALHGGSVQGESEGPGKGSTFTLRLPVSSAVESAPAATPPSVPPRASSARRVLVVDDNIDASELLADGLRYTGHDVRIAHSGASALQLISSFAPDIAVLDIGLPDMDGYELASRIRAEPGSGAVRLFALTGYGREHDRARSRAAGFTHHFVKPVDLTALLERVNTD